jgi:hypothetical protein
MAGFRLVTVETGVIGEATLKLDGYDIDGTAVMAAAGARV